MKKHKYYAGVRTLWRVPNEGKIEVFWSLVSPKWDLSSTSEEELKRVNIKQISRAQAQKLFPKAFVKQK